MTQIRNSRFVTHASSLSPHAYLITLSALAARSAKSSYFRFAILDFGLFGHRIALSALANTFGGIVNPICSAVLRLITVSNVGSYSKVVSTVVSSILDRYYCFLHTGGVLEKSMATLNIKNLPDRLYKKIQARAHREHRSVAQEVIHILSAATESATLLSILDLQGLGKDVWKNVDAGKHVNRERREWD
jgi:plasmid stability protein